MEPDFKEYEEYLREIQKYRKNIFDDILNKYTNNGSQDFLIDVKTLKIISYTDAEPTIPSYGTLTTYFCEPAHKLIKELSSHQKKDKDTSRKEDKDTSQKEPLEWGKDSGIYSDTSSTADSLQESFTSSDEESDFQFRGHDSKVSEKELRINIKKSKWEFSFRRQDSKVSEDLDGSLKIPICDFSFGNSGNKMFEKDLDSSLKKSKRDLSFGRSVFEKDFDSSLKKSKWDLSIGNSGNKMFEKDLDSSLKKSKRDLSFRRSVFEKDFDSSLKKSKWENRKPNNIPVRRNPAFKRDTSFLRNIKLDDLISKWSLSKLSNNINFSSKQSSCIYYVKKEQTGQEQKTSPKTTETDSS